jgi:putative restriction endonuclease
MPVGSRGNMVMPFFHMRSEIFWDLQPQPGKENVVSVLRQCDSIKQFTENFAGALLSKELFHLMMDADTKIMIRNILLSYFDENTRKTLVSTIQNNKFAYEYSQKLFDYARHQPADVKELHPEDIKETSIRDQGFRKAVVSAYEHRCAICGIRILTSQGHTVVDASHIVPWSEFHNDDIRNGLCLCKLCHWAFDELLLTITNDFKIKTSPILNYNKNIPGNLSQTNGCKIIKPKEKCCWPADVFLNHHVKRFAKAI